MRAKTKLKAQKKFQLSQDCDGTQWQYQGAFWNHDREHGNKADELSCLSRCLKAHQYSKSRCCFIEAWYMHLVAPIASSCLCAVHPLLCSHHAGMFAVPYIYACQLWEFKCSEVFSCPHCSWACTSAVHGLYGQHSGSSAAFVSISNVHLKQSHIMRRQWMAVQHVLGCNY